MLHSTTATSVLVLFLCITMFNGSSASLIVNEKSYADFAVKVNKFDIMDFLGMKKMSVFHAEQNALRAERKLAEYSNPNDKYEPTSNVKNGHAISGKDFSTNTEYFTAVLISPVALCVTGILSIILLNLFLCCRKCFKCLRCDPNDHHTEFSHKDDSAEKRAAYINHQKFVIFIIEMVLCFCVMLADMLCYYGYGYIVSGGKDLLDALDMMKKILDDALAGANTMAGAGTNMHIHLSAAKSTSCPPPSEPAASPAHQAVIDGYPVALNAATAISTSMDTVKELIGNLLSYCEDGKEYVSNYLIAYADVFVFLVWSFAFVSVILFVVFRVCRSTFGTKIAILWGELTFIILLLVCLPFMIFSSLMGDFCMNPSYSAVINSPGSLRTMIEYYATCPAGSESDIETNFKAAKTDAGSVGTTITSSFEPWCDPTNPNYATMGGSGSMVDIDQAGTASSGISTGIDGILAAAACTNLQSVWFKIMNDALCTNFYSGIYSLWVSQFITSFFLFFLIVIASISYHYFGKTSVYVSAPTEQPQDAEQNEKHVEMVPMEAKSVPIEEPVAPEGNEEENL
jgi:hypothetical protein